MGNDLTSRTLSRSLRLNCAADLARSLLFFSFFLFLLFVLVLHSNLFRWRRARNIINQVIDVFLVHLIITGRCRFTTLSFDSSSHLPASLVLLLIIPCICCGERLMVLQMLLGDAAAAALSR